MGYMSKDEIMEERHRNREIINGTDDRSLTQTEQAQTQTSPQSPEEVIQPQPETQIPEGRFLNPKGGSSAVDLSKKVNRDKMWEEYDVWSKLGKQQWMGRPNPFAPIDPEFVEEREALKDQWFLKYYGMTHDQHEQKKIKMTDQYANPILNLNDKFRALSSYSAGATTDWVMDAVGTLPGLSGLDNFYDKVTKDPDPGRQGLREMIAIVVPSIIAGGKAAGITQKLPQDMTKLQRTLASAGIFSATEAAVIGLNDAGEEHNALRALADYFPGIWGPEGRWPIADWAKTLDSDSPKVRKYKNMFETTPLAIAGTVLGAYIKLKGGKRTMEWMEPLDNTSTAYKQKEIVKEADIDKLLRIQEIDTQLSLGSENISRRVEDLLISERESLVQELDRIDDLNAALDALDRSSTKEQNIAAINKIENTPPEQLELEFDPDITPVVNNRRQSVPPGNIARNMADTTAIKTGTSEGDPAPIITEAMRKKGLMVGSTSRDAVLGVAEEARDTGRFNALVDGFRFSAKQMNAAAWDIYTSIIAAENMDEVRDLFLSNRDTKSMLLGRFQVEYINEEQARAAAFAMRDLTDRYLGREIATSSARVMDTLGRESATLAETIQKLQPFADDPRAMDLIIDKMQFLMDEYALNKYISGWQLRNKNWFDQVPPGELDTVIDRLQKEFRSSENAIHAKNLKFTETLQRLSKENPLAMRPLVDAFAHTNGDVDSLSKLMKWAANQVTPTGMLKSPDPQQLNLFARSAWGVIYNNVLSGLSAFRAGVGNTSQLILKPITGILGHGIWGVADDFEGLKRTFYYNGAVFETNRRALKDAWEMMKKANKDPEFMMKAYRKDFVFKDDKAWDILDDMRGVWEQEGNYGRLLQYDMAKNLKEMAKLPYLRYGMTGMVFTDVFSQTHLAHYLSRMRAYDDVFSEFGFADWKKIELAEKEHYAKMFDSNGMITDQALKSVSGELSLNLDDGLSTWINKGTTAYPISKFLFMFPRTGSNVVKNALSWTPMSAIPGINKYSKTIWARTDDQIAAALAEHGIDMATTPNARVLFENLRAEYTGRVAFSSILTKVMWDYAMNGNIRGNGHYNASRRTKERDQLGYDPKTINIAGKWVSFKGIIGVDPILTILGDIAYYARDLEQPFLEDWQSKLMWTIAATFLNETPLQGLEPLVAAANGDMSGWARLTANSARAMIPQSGALGVLSNAITSTQKDIEADVVKYVQNKIPIASSFLPEQRDFWTGEALNDIDNPFLRILNSLSPIKISGTQEVWRKWLLTTGWDGLGRLKQHSDGSRDYTPEEREEIYGYIGDMQLYKKLIPLMKNKAYQKQIGQLRYHRAHGDDTAQDAVELKSRLLPLFREIDKIVRVAQKEAERMFMENNESFAKATAAQQLTDMYMKQGNVPAAAAEQGRAKKDRETRQLLQMPK